jgi:hypothetical protein
MNLYDIVTTVAFWTATAVLGYQFGKWIDSK